MIPIDALENRLIAIARKRLAGDLRLEVLETEVFSHIGAATRSFSESITAKLYGISVGSYMQWAAAKYTGDFSAIDQTLTQLIDEWAKQHEPDTEPMPTGPAKIMTRRGLVEAHKAKWPTIETDIQHASENGLNAAKAGTRGWDEGKALTWAQSRGKMKPDSGYTARVHRVT